MKSIFSPDGVLFHIAERVGNLILLNLLYIVCCIPIVTIGPATAALHYVTLKYAADEEDRVLKPFLHSFRQNMKQGMIIGLLSTALGVFLALDLYYMYQIASNGTLFNKVALVAVALACLLYLMVMTYVYPLLARYDNSLKQMLRTALILAITHLPATVCMTVLSLAPILLLLYTFSATLLSIAFYLFIGFAAIAFFQDKLMVRIFWQYTPRTTEDEE